MYVQCVAVSVASLYVKTLVVRDVLCACVLCVCVCQRNDIATAISKYDQFDFLIDIVPREEIRPATKRVRSSSLSALHTCLSIC